MPFYQLNYKDMVAVESLTGIEPVTSAFRERRSTTELQGHYPPAGQPNADPPRSVLTPELQSQ